MLLTSIIKIKTLPIFMQIISPVKYTFKYNWNLTMADLSLENYSLALCCRCSLSVYVSSMIWVHYIMVYHKYAGYKLML